MEKNETKKGDIIVAVAVLIVLIFLFVVSSMDFAKSDNNMEEKINTDSEIKTEVSSISVENQKIIDDSGVKVEVKETGDGIEISQGKLVAVDYIGTLEDGTEFDNSYKRGAPLEFVYGGGQLIKGFEIGMLGMKVGDRRMIHIPSELGYGDREMGNIPANSNLIFEVKLVKVNE